MKRLLLTIIVIFAGLSLYGQTYNTLEPSKTQWMIRGYGHTGFSYSDSGDEKESTFLGPSLSPVILFKHSDRLMFEAEFEFELEDDELETGLEYADIMYVLNDYLTVRAGKILLPFGTFTERFHPAWINRLPTRPLGFGHDGITPGSGIGVELRGAFALEGPQLNYSVYLTNGPRLNDGIDEPEEAGMLHFSNFEDNNLNKAVGGRLGILPFSNSSVEIGLSGYSTGGLGDEETRYENVGAFLYALDLSLVKQITSLKGIADIKAQYNNSEVDTAEYIEVHEAGEEGEYTFDNNSDSFYGQLSFRPTMAENNIVKNLEVVGRYSFFNAPEGAEWEEQSEQFAFGLNYWLTWRSVIKLSFQTTEREGGHDNPGISNTDELFLQWAIGF